MKQASKQNLSKISKYIVGIRECTIEEKRGEGPTPRFWQLLVETKSLPLTVPSFCICLFKLHIPGTEPCTSLLGSGIFWINLPWLGSYFIEDSALPSPGPQKYVLLRIWCGGHKSSGRKFVTCFLGGYFHNQILVLSVTS